MNPHFVKGVIVGRRIKITMIGASYTITPAAFNSLRAFLSEADYPTNNGGRPSTRLKVAAN